MRRELAENVIGFGFHVTAIVGLVLFGLGYMGCSYAAGHVKNGAKKAMEPITTAREEAP